MTDSRLAAAPYELVKAAFNAAVACDAGVRAEVLEAHCNGDAVLRAEVESLLAHAEEPAVDLERAAAAIGSLLVLADDSTDIERIGPYRIERVLGRGGMGVVYLATCERPRRTVAVKVMRSGAHGPHLRRRFEHEMEALARLQHPGIAQIFDAGVAPTTPPRPDGPCPYIAMEHVEGASLGVWVREHGPDVRTRLAMVATLCDAVQHAHQRGVIHRDLKPANVIVDREGRPKILDFGIARISDEDMTRTVTGPVVGTLPYMSPEQVAGRSDVVDTRSDVYALGVILFELVAGRLPLDLSDRSVVEAARIITDEIPVSLATLDTRWRGDIDTIARRALDKDPDRRYQSPAALAADIRHFLRGEPIEARRDSLAYVMRKRLVRYRGLVIAGAVGAVALASFAVYAALQAREYSDLAMKEYNARLSAVASEQIAANERDAARQARDAEVVQRRAAEAAADHGAAVSAFLVDLIGLADPNVTQTYDRTIHTMLDGAAETVDTRFDGQPQAESLVRTHLGRVYASIGESVKARFQLERALDILRSDPTTPPEAIYAVLWPLLHVLPELDIVFDTEPRTEAGRVVLEIIELRDPAVREALVPLPRRPDVEESRALLDTMMETIATIDPDETTWQLCADRLYLLGYGRRDMRQYEIGAMCLSRALEIQRRALNETDFRIARTLALLVECEVEAGRPLEGERLARESLDVLGAVLPADHWYMDAWRARLGTCLAAQEQWGNAEMLLAGALPGLVAARGESNRAVTDTLTHLVRLYEAAERPADAEAMRVRLARGLAGSVRRTPWRIALPVFGPQHATLLETLKAVRGALPDRDNDVVEAADRFVTVRRQTLADDDPRAALLADRMTAWVEGYANRRDATNRRTKQAVMARLIGDAAQISRASSLRHPRKTAVTLWWQAVNHESWREYEAAEPIARECLQIMETLGPSYGMLANARTLLGGCLSGLERYEEAEPLLLGGYRGLIDAVGWTNVNTTNALGRIKTLYVRLETPERWDAVMQERLIHHLEHEHETSIRGADKDVWRAIQLPTMQTETYVLAQTLAHRHLETDPDRGWYRTMAGVAAFRLGDIEGAAEILRESFAQNKGRYLTDSIFLVMALDHIGATSDEIDPVLLHMTTVGSKRTDALSLSLLAEVAAALGDEEW